MACAEPLLQLDDQSFALQLQLEEVEAQRDIQCGKWNEDSPPDFALAFHDFEAELKKAMLVVEDLKFAHSIAKAVDSDSMAIDELRAEETRSIQDRDMALSLNEGENMPVQDVTELSNMFHLGSESADWGHVLRATEASTDSIDSCTTAVAGPSVHYADRQRAVLEHLPQLRVECIICGDSFYPHATVSLLCNDIYCKQCLKSFFLSVAKDESLFPPRCCRQQINISVIESNLSEEEMNVYRSAELEFGSTGTDRVYCADPECAKFIPLPQRTRNFAFCEACSARTCVHCKRLAHDGPCQPDETRQSLIIFANEHGYKPCSGCGEMVSRDVGCDHMTCRCNAEFCYRCGVKWKECLCGDWEPGLLNQRAQEVVDREAPLPLPPIIRQEHVAHIAQELRENHECDHSGVFTRLDVDRRSGQACEVCGIRRRIYLLSCNRCHLLTCEYCRRHRLQALRPVFLEEITP